MGSTNEQLTRRAGPLTDRNIMIRAEPTLEVMVEARNGLQREIRAQMGGDLTKETLELACSSGVQIDGEIQEWQADQPVLIGKSMWMTERVGVGSDRLRMVTRLPTDNSGPSIKVRKPDGSVLVFSQPNDTGRVNFEHWV